MKRLSVGNYWTYDFDCARCMCAVKLCFCSQHCMASELFVDCRIKKEVFGGGGATDQAVKAYTKDATGADLVLEAQAFR